MTTEERLFRRFDARLSTFPVEDPHNQAAILARQGLICTRDSRLYCWCCYQPGGKWADQDRHVHSPHLAIPHPRDNVPAVHSSQRTDPRRFRIPDIGPVGPNVRIRVKGVQDSGQGAAALCISGRL